MITFFDGHCLLLHLRIGAGSEKMFTRCPLVQICNDRILIKLVNVCSGLVNWLLGVRVGKKVFSIPSPCESLSEVPIVSS